jgi:uncharacterized protein YoxC
LTDRELLELIAAQVSKLTTQVEGLTTQVEGLTTQVEGLTTQVEGLATQVEGLATQVDILTKDMAGVKDIVIKIENDHGQKLGALLNGYKQNAERLDRIEKEVAKHEEIILRRIN